VSKQKSKKKPTILELKRDTSHHLGILYARIANMEEIFTDYITMNGHIEKFEEYMKSLKDNDDNDKG